VKNIDILVLKIPRLNIDCSCGINGLQMRSSGVQLVLLECDDKIPHCRTPEGEGGKGECENRLLEFKISVLEWRIIKIRKLAADLRGGPALPIPRSFTKMQFRHCPWGEADVSRERVQTFGEGYKTCFGGNLFWNSFL